MKLNSARDLKAELRVTLNAQDVRSGPDLLIALGIAPGRNDDDYRLAVRSPVALPHPLVDRLQRETGREVDFRITGLIAAELPVTGARAERELRIGSSIAHYRCSAGTVGFFARRSSDGAVGVVSNNHVLAATDIGADGDDVLSPAPADRGRQPRDVVANLDGNYPRLCADAAVVDCAFAPLLRHVQYDPRSLVRGLNVDPASALPDAQSRVAKIGRTTGHTQGVITAFELDGISVLYREQTVLLNGQIEIDSVDGKPFCRKGDSGALVFDPNGRPVALLYAMAPIGGSHGCGLAYANAIDLVLAKLGVAFVT